VYLFPPILLAIQLFVAFSRLGLRGDLWPLVIVYVAQTLPLAIPAIAAPACSCS
jgi:multiple sugar transport system permease protein